MTTSDDSGRAKARWKFALYKAGRKEVMLRAESTLRRLCDQHLPGRYEIVVVDVFEDPDSLPQDVLAVPTVVRLFPKPERRVVGDLSQSTEAAEWLGLTEAEMIDEL